MNWGVAVHELLWSLLSRLPENMAIAGFIGELYCKRGCYSEFWVVAHEFIKLFNAIIHCYVISIHPHDKRRPRGLDC